MSSSTKNLRTFNKSRVANFLEGTISPPVESKKIVIIIGFWRSGTTYLLESLQKLTNSRICFEPLQDIALKENKLNYQGFEFKFKQKSINQFYPVVNPTLESSEYDVFFDDLFHGKISSGYTRRTQPLRALMSNRLLIKMVRANLIAAYLHKKYNLKTIFIIRNPAGVVSSIVRKKGGTKAIKACLANNGFIDYLVDSINEETSFLKGKLGVVERYRGDDIGRITLAWCLLNYIPLKQIESGVFSPQVVRYEDLGSNPIQVLSQLTDVDLDPSKIQFNSSTTKKERRENNKIRVNSWKTELSETQLDLIFRIVNEFDKGLFSPYLTS